MPKDTDDFVHLHLHSDFSSLDGAGRIDEYVEVAKERGNPAIAVTDHGTLRGMLKQYEACKEHGVKPIFGSEFYISRDMRRKGLTDEEKAEITKGVPKSDAKAAIKAYEEREGIRDRWHTNVWAKDADGLRNMYRLSSSSFIDGFYYKPRIDANELIKYGKGLIVSTGCLSSPIHDNVMLGREREALEHADKMFEAFGEDMRLELQPHAIREQRAANKFTLKLWERYGKKVPLIATQDAHYVHKSDAEHHDVLLCIGTGANLDTPGRFKFDGDEFHMRTRKEMFAAFRRHHEFIPKEHVKRALDATMEMAEIVTAELKIDYHAALLPRPNMPGEFGDDDFAYLKAICLDGWSWRGIERRSHDLAKRRGRDQPGLYAEYIARLKHELKALKKQKFVPYFLIIRELYAFAREAGIMCGPGRGSVGGSLVAYLLGITAVDPIEHGLIFERFINPFRMDMPDVDMDFEDRRRGEIIEWLIKRFGRDKVAQIATVGKLSGKQCILDVSRVLQVPLAEVRQVTSSIIERSSGDERASQTIEDSFKDFEVCRQFNAKYPKVLHHARRLEGLSKSLGIHAAGVVTSPVPLADIIPLEIRNHGGEKTIVTAFDMYGAAAFGLVKLDILGLRTLTVIKEALEAIKEHHGVDIDMEAEEFNLNDPKVLAAFTARDFGGVFQYDTTSAEKVCSGVNFTDFEDIAAMTALNRPGTARSGLATKYVERKKNPKLVKKIDFHPLVSEITKDTLGIIVYQEHVIRIFTDCAGFAPGTADSLRKTIAKKVGDETIGKEHEGFVKGCREHSGIDEKTANKIFSAIKFFGSYGFNKTICENAWVWKAGANASDPRRQVQIGELARRWNERDPRDTSRLSPMAKKLRDGRFSIICMDEDGRCRPSALLGIHDHGVKKTYVIKLASGNVTPAISREHRLMTENGYKSIKSGLAVGTKLVFMGENTTLDYCSWWMNDDTNFAQTSRNNESYKAACDAVWARAESKCEQCSAECERRRGGGEVAHMQTPAACAYSHAAYHSPGNLKLLCNSCHKKLDYEKGERKARWKKGRPTFLDEVVAIEEAGEVQCYDLEVENDGHNFVAGSSPDAPPVVSHNSHATEYGMIAYWTMWIKVYYPIEFYWALLKNEPERIRVGQLAKDAKKHGIQLLPPHVNSSRAGFTIDRENNAVRGSLVDIKGVGEKAAKTIMENQPFKSWTDFITRVERRSVHKGVVLALAKAGALSGLIPSSKWLVENIEEFWKAQGKKKGGAEAMLEAAKGAPDYEPEEQALVASSVNPLAFGKHPIDAYKEFIERAMKVEIAEMGREEFFHDYDNKGCFIAGVILEVKYNQVGDFHTGLPPTEEEKKEMFWGARYANVNIEEASGKQNRCKFDIDIFDEVRPVVDAGVGTPVLAHIVPNLKYENLRAQFVVDLGVLRAKMASGEPLNVWEKIVTGNHPAKTYAWKDKETRKKRCSNIHFKRSSVGGRFCGVVTNVKLKYDKNGNKMAFFGLIGADNTFVDVIAFASTWQYVSPAIKAGRLIVCDIEKKPDTLRGWSYFCGDRVAVMKKA